MYYLIQIIHNNKMRPEIFRVLILKNKMIYNIGRPCLLLANVHWLQ